MVDVCEIFLGYWNLELEFFIRDTSTERGSSCIDGVADSNIGFVIPIYVSRGIYVTHLPLYLHVTQAGDDDPWRLLFRATSRARIDNKYHYDCT